MLWRRVQTSRKKNCLFYDTLFTHFKLNAREMSPYWLNTTFGMKIFTYSLADIGSVQRLTSFLHTESPWCCRAGAVVTSELLTRFSSWRCCRASRCSSCDRLCCPQLVGTAADLTGPVGGSAICGVATADVRLSTLCP
jgi:hypothetical protein